MLISFHTQNISRYYGNTWASEHSSGGGDLLFYFQTPGMPRGVNFDLTSRWTKKEGASVSLLPNRSSKQTQDTRDTLYVCWLLVCVCVCARVCVGHTYIGCLTSQQQASVSHGRICSDNFTCCHTEIEVADQTFYLTRSQYTDTGRTSPSADPITPGAWQGSHWNASFWVTGVTRPRKNSVAGGIRTRDLPLSRRTP